MGKKKPRRPDATGVRFLSVPALLGQPLLGSQDLVENACGLLFISLFSQCQFRNQDLTGLGQHALLSRGETPVVIAAPEIANDLRYLDNVTGSKLFQVCLVTT